MKNIVVVIIAFIISALPSRSVAYDSRKSLRVNMMDYNNTKKAWSSELEKTRTHIAEESEKYGYNFSLMDQATLNQFIQYQKRYLMIKRIFAENLAEIYFENHNGYFKVQNQDLKSFLGHHCTIWEEISGSCDKHQKILVHEAQYLNQKIQNIEMLESSLANAIADEIIDNDKTTAAISHSKNTFKMN